MSILAACSILRENSPAMQRALGPPSVLALLPSCHVGVDEACSQARLTLPCPAQPDGSDTEEGVPDVDSRDLGSSPIIECLILANSFNLLELQFSC